jgi:nucleoside-diphosphate-sugar epimerase
MKKILVFGSNGFIGSEVMSYFNQKGNFFAKGIQRAKGNSNVYYFKSYSRSRLMNLINNFDIIIDCISHSQNNKQVNCLSSQIASNCRIKKKKITYFVFSSIGVYGFDRNSTKKQFIHSYSKLNPMSEYERSKIKLEKKISSIKNNYFDPVILRLGIVVGKNMKSNFMKKLINFIKSPIFFFIDTKETIINCIHIKDICLVLESIILKNNNKKKIYNVTNNYYLKNFVKLLIKKESFQKKVIINSSLISNFVNFYNFFFFFKKINLNVVNVLSNRRYVDNKSLRNKLNISFKFTEKKIIKELVK